MARSCAVCGKVSMDGFNPQSSGMNRVRAHRRYHPNLQQTTIQQNLAANQAVIQTWITAHPTGATLTAAQTLTVAKMLNALCNLLLAEFGSTSGT